jgi:hypothetical protein
MVPANGTHPVDTGNGSDAEGRTAFCSVCTAPLIERD